MGWTGCFPLKDYTPAPGEAAMDTTTPPFASIAIDIGKEVLHIVGFNIGGKIVFPRKIKRLALGDIMLGVGD
jgi:hypothetical protein